MKIDPIEISGLTLVDKLLEFISMTPDNSNWTFEKLKDNEPRLVRLKQIDCLLKLFVPEIYKSTNLKFSIENILNGNFIRLRKINAYDNVFHKMDILISKEMSSSHNTKEWTYSDLEYNYKKLLEFKIQYNMILNFNNGIIEISYPYLFSYILTKKVSERIIFAEVDSFLSSVIDPTNRIFTKEKLIKEIDYPNKDVFDIDLENW